MKLKQLLALLLAILMIVGTFTMVACGDEKDDGGKTDGEKTDGKKTDGEKTDGDKTDGDKTDGDKTDGDKTDPDPIVDNDEYAILSQSFDFSGADEVVLAWNGGLVYYEEAEDVNDGDAVDSATYRRQNEIEDKLGVTYTLADLGNAEPYAIVSEAVKAGLQAYDLVTVHMKFGANIALDNCLRNINKFPTIDLTKDWWNHSINDMFAYKTVQYWTTGDITTGYINNLVAVFVDDSLFESYTGKTVNQLFTEVTEGKWTAEKVLEYTNGVYSDENVDKIKNEGDLCGWYYDNTGWVVSAYATALGYNYSEKSSSKYVIALGGAENEAIFEKTKELIHSAYFLPCSIADSEDMFKDGLCMFTHQTIDNLGKFRDRQEDFSIIPMPKLNETDEYRTPSYDGIHLFGIVSTVPAERYELIGAFTELFAAMGRSYVTEALFEKTLKSKYSRNDGSYKCMDLVRESGYCDFAFCWTGPLGQIDIFLSGVILGNASSLAGAAQSEQSIYQKRLDGIYTTLAKQEKADKAQSE